MKVKDLVDMKGCYSAYDVGELEVTVLSVDEIKETIYQWGIAHQVIDKFGDMLLGCDGRDVSVIAKKIHKAMVKKRRKA